MHYPIPIHLQRPFEKFGCKEGDLPVTEEIARTELSLPMYAELTDPRIECVVEVIRAGMPR